MACHQRAYEQFLSSENFDASGAQRQPLALRPTAQMIVAVRASTPRNSKNGAVNLARKGGVPCNLMQLRDGLAAGQRSSGGRMRIFYSTMNKHVFHPPVRDLLSSPLPGSKRSVCVTDQAICHFLISWKAQTTSIKSEGLTDFHVITKRTVGGTAKTTETNSGKIGRFDRKRFVAVLPIKAQRHQTK
jgi:hypothetical protein